MTQMEGPFEEELGNIDPIVSVIESFKVTYDLLRSCMDGLDCWVLMAMDAMEESPRNNVVASVGDNFVLIGDGIQKIGYERDSINEAAAKLPPVFPYQYAKSNMSTLVQCLNVHEVYIKRRFSEQKISQIDEEFTA